MCYRVFSFRIKDNDVDCISINKGSIPFLALSFVNKYKLILK